MDDVIKIGSKWQSTASKVLKTVVHIENDIVFFICAPSAFYGVEQGGAQPLDSFLQRNIPFTEKVTKIMCPVFNKQTKNYFMVSEENSHIYKTKQLYIVSDPIKVTFKPVE